MKHINCSGNHSKLLAALLDFETTTRVLPLKLRILALNSPWLETRGLLVMVEGLRHLTSTWLKLLGLLEFIEALIAVSSVRISSFYWVRMLAISRSWLLTFSYKSFIIVTRFNIVCDSCFIMSEYARLCVDSSTESVFVCLSPIF